MFPIKPVSSTLIVNVSSAICWNLPNDMSSVFTLLPCVWPDSRFDLPIISEPSSHGCNSLGMLESMFDDVKRMDKRQFLYQVIIGSPRVCQSPAANEKSITVLQEAKHCRFCPLVWLCPLLWWSGRAWWSSLAPSRPSLSSCPAVWSPPSRYQSIKYIQDYCITFTPWFFAFGPIFCRGETCSFWPTTRRRTSGSGRLLSSRLTGETSRLCTG